MSGSDFRVQGPYPGSISGSDGGAGEDSEGNTVDDASYRGRSWRAASGKMEAGQARSAFAMALAAPAAFDEGAGSRLLGGSLEHSPAGQRPGDPEIRETSDLLGQDATALNNKNLRNISAVLDPDIARTLPEGAEIVQRSALPSGVVSNDQDFVVRAVTTRQIPQDAARELVQSLVDQGQTETVSIEGLPLSQGLLLHLNKGRLIINGQRFSGETRERLVEHLKDLASGDTDLAQQISCYSDPTYAARLLKMLEDQETEETIGGGQARFASKRSKQPEIFLDKELDGRVRVTFRQSQDGYWQSRSGNWRPWKTGAEASRQKAFSFFVGPQGAVQLTGGVQGADIIVPPSAEGE